MAIAKPSRTIAGYLAMVGGTVLAYLLIRLSPVMAGLFSRNFVQTS